MQGDNSKYLKVSSCCKHYAVYNLENWNGNDRASFNAITSDFDLNETYLVPFKYCIMEGKASSLMCSYNAGKIVFLFLLSLFLFFLCRF